MSRSVTIVTPPDDKLIVSLDEAKLHCHVTHNAENAWFTKKIKEVYNRIEGKTGRTLLPTTYELRDCDSVEEILLPKPICTAVSAVGFIDRANAKTVIDAANWTFFPEETPQNVSFIDMDVVRGLAPANLRSYYVTFTCGYADAAALPDWVGYYALEYIAAFYAMRARTSTDASSGSLDPVKTLDNEILEHRVDYL